MPIEDRNLQPGMKLEARYKGEDYACTVMEGEDKGGLRFMLDDLDDNRLSSAVFRSLSAAGSAVTGNACNGWAFWSRKGQGPKPRQAKTAPPEAAAFRRIPGGRAWCDGCAAAFRVDRGVTPSRCPEGHTPTGVEAEKVEA